VCSQWLDWETAWHRALYGVDGFVHTGGQPAQHFRTSAHVGTVLAEALLELLERTDHALGRPAELDVVDLGAGGGELLASIVELAPASLHRRLRPVAVDVRPTPPRWQLPWLTQLPDGLVGLVIAHEWLDALPCPVVQHDGALVRRVQVCPDGGERLGPALGDAERAWLRRWWSLTRGGRAEVGLGRDGAWREVLGRLHAGAALAVDYCHLSGERPHQGTLAAYREGRQVRPVPDGSCDLTAHVSMDSVAAVARGTVVSQARALGTQGAAVQAGSWLERAVRGGQVAELTDPAGLGGFGWVLHPARIDLTL